MELTEKKILSNSKKFFETGLSIKLFDEVFVEDNHNNLTPQKSATCDYEGGFIHETLLNTKHAITINETIIPEDLRFEKEQLIKLVFLTKLSQTISLNDELGLMSVEKLFYFCYKNKLDISDNEIKNILPFLYGTFNIFSSIMRMANDLTKMELFSDEYETNK
jgi:hypothetical protein